MNKKSPIASFVESHFLWIVIGVFAVIVAVFFAVNYESDEALTLRLGRESYNKMFQKSLKDPSSLVIYEERYSFDEDGSVHWVLDVGARNGFGGMARKTYKLRTSRYLSDRVYNEDPSDDSFSYFDAYRGEFIGSLSSGGDY